MKVLARPIVFVCIVALTGTALGPDESIRSIVIVDKLTGLQGGDTHTFVDRFIITPAGKGFVRLGPDGSPQGLPPGVVGNFVRLAKAWRYPRPSAHALMLTPIQQSILEGDLQKKCGYGGSVDSALSAYYAQDTIWTDDYPNVEVTIDYGNGKITRLLSRTQQLFGLPWRTAIAKGRESLDFDSELSRALAPLLGARALNADRFSGLWPRGDDALLNIAGVACDADSAKNSHS
ncbi:MAG TPA: hypothetical protein VIW73_06490 [Candidatus Cybelea sp.]